MESTLPTINMSLSLKPPRVSLEDVAQSAPKIIFLHPGYNNQNLLLILPCFDSGGIHHETAHIACAILANCRWDGYLSSIRNGPRLSAGFNDVLPPGQYYFCIEGEEDYPIVPTFDHFTCPSSLPPSYSSAPIGPSSARNLARRDGTCRITASALPNETAHILPAAQSEWWNRNGMVLYTNNTTQGRDINCVENTILLRRDVQKLWDDHKFAIVPKAGKWVAHALCTNAEAEITERYHNQELQPLAGISPHLLLCRFAMGILSASQFLFQNTPRKLILVDDEDPAGAQVRNMGLDEFRRFRTTSTRAASKSQSSNKRQRSTADDPADDEYATEESEDNESEDEERGRPRKRKWLFNPWASPTLFGLIDVKTEALAPGSGMPKHASETITIVD